MKVLKDILYKVNLKEIIGLTDVIISNVQFDSRICDSCHRVTAELWQLCVIVI